MLCSPLDHSASPFQLPPSALIENASQREKEMTLVTFLPNILQESMDFGPPNELELTRLFEQHQYLFEAEESFAADGTTNPVNEVSDQIMGKDNQANTSPVKRKARSHTGSQGVKRQTNDLQFKASLIWDREKCRAQKKQAPEETYFTPSIQNRLLGLGEETYRAFGTIIVQIGSAQALLAFREALQCTRRTCGLPHNPRWLSRNVSSAERFKIIGEIQANATYLKILEWNHIMYLFRCSGGPEICPNAGIISVPGNELVAQSVKRGNPRNIAKAQVIDKMMEEIFPGLDRNSEHYKWGHRKVSYLQRLGKRLHMLAQKFGDGVIGLLPFSRCSLEDGPTIDKGMQVSLIFILHQKPRH